MIVFRCPGACLGRLELTAGSITEAWFRAEQHGWQIVGSVATCRNCTAGGAR